MKTEDLCRKRDNTAGGWLVGWLRPAYCKRQRPGLSGQIERPFILGRRQTQSHVAKRI